MKKAFQIIWPVLLPIAVYLPYMFFKCYVILEWLGLDYHSTYSFFDANDFTVCFWGMIALISIIGSFFCMKHFPQKVFRGIYILIVVFLSILFVYLFAKSTIMYCD